VAAQVLVRLGADLNRVRGAVIKLVHAGEGEAGEAGPSPLGRDFLLTEIRSTLRSISDRLTAIERHLGMTDRPAAVEDDPPVPPADPPAAASDDN
jgi:hypothetical protein